MTKYLVRDKLSSERMRERWRDPDFRAKITLSNSKVRTQQVIDNVKEGLKRKWTDPDYRAKQTKTRQSDSYRAHQRQMSQARSLTWIIPEAKTQIEIMVGRALIGLNLRFQCQYPIDRLCADFFLPNHNLVIECYGCYWHGCNICFPDGKRLANSIARNSVIRSKGYSLLILWEHEIRQGLSSEMIARALK